MHWINPDEIVGIDRGSVILFGAGKGTEEFIEFLTACRPEVRVIAIADNNKSLHGKTLKGVPIIVPEAIPALDFDKIVVTSISGRDTIARQLHEMAFAESKDFLLVGRYPSSHRQNLDTVLEGRDLGIELDDETCLSIGPGGFLGLEVLLFCMGAKQVCAIDNHGFGIHYPDITPREDDYMEILDVLPAIAPFKHGFKKAQRRFHSLLVRNSDRLFMDTDKIDSRCPMDVCSLAYPDAHFDIALSFAVLEHVRNPQRSISEMHHVIRPGGYAIHRKLQGACRGGIGSAHHRRFPSRISSIFT